MRASSHEVATEDTRGRQYRRVSTRSKPVTWRVPSRWVVQDLRTKPRRTLAVLAMEQASAPGLASLALLSLGSACLAAVSTYALFWGAAEGRTLRSTQVVQDSGHRHNAKGQGHDRCTVEADQRGQDTQPRQTDQRKGCDACHCLESKRADPRDPQPRTGWVRPRLGQGQAGLWACGANAEQGLAPARTALPLVCSACNPVPLILPSLVCRYLTWDEYFMSLAFLSAQRSKDPNKQVRA